MANPGIGTRLEPFSSDYVTRADASLSRGMANPGIGTRLEPFSSDYVTRADASLSRGMANPGIGTRLEPFSSDYVTRADASLSRGMANPGIGTRLEPFSSDYVTRADASLSRGMANPGIGTRLEPFSSDYVTRADASLSRSLINTQSGPPDASFVTAADASLGRALVEPEIATLAEPFAEDAVIRNGSGIHLQGSPADSTGAFLRVNGQDHFVSAEGRFSITVDPGTFTIQIRAPGYLPVDIVSPSGSSIVLGSGDVLTIPELTMVYGDANGDGAIDVRDLALGGRNFGATPGELELTPQ